jgi:hypothetical protein
MMKYRENEHDTRRKEKIRDKRSDGNNISERIIIANDYSCYLYVGSLVQDQLKPWVIKYLSGSD